MNYKKAKKGDELLIPAETWNGLLDVLAESRGGSTSPRPPVRALPLATAVLPIWNKTGADVERYRAVAVDAPVVTPDDNQREFERRVIVKGRTPNAAYQKRWGIVQEAIPVDGWGHVVVAGVTIARVNIGDVADEWLVTDPGQTILITAETGTAQLLWVKGGVGTASSTGEQWALIRLIGGGDDVGHVQHQVKQMVSQHVAGWNQRLAVPDIVEVQT